MVVLQIIALNQLDNDMYEASQEAPQLIVFFIKNQGALEEEGGYLSIIQSRMKSVRPSV